MHKAVVISFLLNLLLIAPGAGSTGTDRPNGVAAKPAQETAREYYLNGEKALKDGDVLSAVIWWERVLSVKPGSSYTKKRMESVRSKLNAKQQQALQAYRLALALRSQGDVDRSLAAIQQACSLESQCRCLADMLDVLVEAKTKKFWEKDCYGTLAPVSSSSLQDGGRYSSSGTNKDYEIRSEGTENSVVGETPDGRREQFSKCEISLTLLRVELLDERRGMVARERIIRQMLQERYANGRKLGRKGELKISFYGPDNMTCVHYIDRDSGRLAYESSGVGDELYYAVYTASDGRIAYSSQEPDVIVVVDADDFGRHLPKKTHYTPN